jgi:Sec-independent protein translocase protein TatA
VNFLNVGPWELSVILIIAILLVGPKRLLEVLQAIRRFSGQLRRMSTEFTSLIQSEIQASERETSQAPEGATSGKLATTPIASIQTELQTAAQEARQALERVVKDELEPIADLQAELQTAAQETRRALEDTVEDASGSIADIEAEPPTSARETRQALESTAEGASRPGETQDHEASDTDPAD